MTKDELRKALEEGKQLDELFEFTDGQECQIFKAKCVAHFAGNHEIVYIPDTDLNEIDTDRVLASMPEIECVLMFCFTGHDFFEICGCNEKMARRVFDACDWQCPDTEYDEQQREEEEDPETQACMDRDQIWKYTHGKGYAWHITELKTYETPLDLSAFHLRCENALRWCNNGGCAMHIEQPANGNCCGNYGLQLNRPPQSWCYVVGPGECHKELQEQVKATLNRLYPRKKVSDILPKPEILGQLAEELAEASAAASKLRRKIDGKNPTPKTLEECWEDLKKEIGDVMNSIDALTGQDPQNYHEFMSECGEYAEPKMERWLFHLNEQKEEHA